MNFLFLNYFFLFKISLILLKNFFIFIEMTLKSHYCSKKAANMAKIYDPFRDLNKHVFGIRIKYPIRNIFFII